MCLPQMRRTPRPAASLPARPAALPQEQLAVPRRCSSAAQLIRIISTHGIQRREGEDAPCRAGDSNSGLDDQQVCVEALHVKIAESSHDSPPLGTNRFAIPSDAHLRTGCTRADMLALLGGWLELEEVEARTAGWCRRRRLFHCARRQTSKPSDTTRLSNKSSLAANSSFREPANGVQNAACNKQIAQVACRQHHTGMSGLQ